MKREQISKEDKSKHLSFDALAVHQDKQYHLVSKEYDSSSEHPTPEQMLIREAVKYLTPKQRVAWEYYNYDRMTEDEIADKLRISRDSVHDRLQGAEKKMTKWVKSNLGTYKLLKGDNHE